MLFAAREVFPLVGGCSNSESVSSVGQSLRLQMKPRDIDSSNRAQRSLIAIVFPPRSGTAALCARRLPRDLVADLADGDSVRGADCASETGRQRPETAQDEAMAT